MILLNSGPTLSSHRVSSSSSSEGDSPVIKIKAQCCGSEAFDICATKCLNLNNHNYTLHKIVTWKAKTDLMALAIFDRRLSLTCSYAAIFDQMTMKLGFQESCIIVHHKYKFINLWNKLSSCTSGLNGDGQSKISSAIRSVFAFQVTIIFCTKANWFVSIERVKSQLNYCICTCTC